MRELAELKDTIIPRRPAVRRLVRPLPGRLQQVSEHLYVWNNSYFLLSDDGPSWLDDRGLAGRFRAGETVVTNNAWRTELSAAA